jgi:twitching motility protein PilT
MSQLAALVSMLKESGAERVFFAPNEAGVALEGETKRALPGGALSPNALREAASELLSHDDIQALSASRPRIVRHEHDGEEFVLEIVRHGEGVAIGLRATMKPARAPAARGLPTRRRTREQPQVKAPPIELDLPPKPEVDRIDTKPVRRVDGPPPTAKSAAKIDALLHEMIEKKASDLHLSSGNVPVFRIDGEIHYAVERGALGSDEIQAMLNQIFSNRAREDFDAKNDADFAYEVPGLARFRVNAFRDRNGVGTVLRQIPIEILSAEKLGLPKACLDLCWLSKGLVVVTGPTGSGKSTTLAAMIDFINRNRTDHIITIEDPVEFVHPNRKCLINQREVGQHTDSFKNALRAALREDPDIVLVGEMRDLETIAIAIETAETGHLVFGTLHTTTAISTIDRIIDQFPTDRQEQIRVMLSESLKGVVAQVLCPKIGGGRVAAHEILLGTSAVSAMIRDGKTFQLTSTMQTSKAQGMVTMNDSLLALVQKHLVDPKQAYIKAVDKTGFVNLLKQAGIQPPV